jgi:hypothetical protein
MRWTYIIPRLIIVGLLWGFLTYGVDPLLGYLTVQSFQSVTGAKVDVRGLKTTYFPPSITIQGMAFARAGRTGKNMAEFDEMGVKLEPHSLSRRRFVIVCVSILNAVTMASLNSLMSRLIRHPRGLRIN